MLKFCQNFYYLIFKQNSYANYDGVNYSDNKDDE